MTLYEYFVLWREKQKDKHDLGCTFVKESINSLSNTEFLQELSSFFEEAGIFLGEKR